MRNYVLLLFLFLSIKATAQQPVVQWSFDTKDASFGQSAAADLDGDGKLEIVFGCYRNDSCIYVLNAEDGSLLWKYNTGSALAEGCNDVAPTIYDVDKDGQPEVIVASSCTPKTYCFNGKTGALKWVCNTRGSDSPPTIADIDGDGIPEILHGEFGGYVICINAENGSIKWEIAVDPQSSIQTAPTILDIGNDGQSDFVIATWNTNVKTDNKIYAYRGDNHQLLWTHALTDVVYHGSAVGDIDGDGIPEILVGCYNDTLYCLNSENGQVKWTYSVGNNFYVGGPAQIADLDNDGNCEVIFTAWFSVVALKGNGQLFWQYDIPHYYQSFRGAAIADINGDNYPDVVLGTDGGTLLALNGNDGTLIFNKNLRSDYGDSLFSFDNAPLIADFDQDGTKDIFIVGGHAEFPNFNNNFGRAYMVRTGVGKGPDWLMFQGNIRRTSNVCTTGNSTGINPADQDQTTVTLIPNPVHHQAEIKLYLSNPGIVSYSVSNLLGQMIGQGVAPQKYTSGIHHLYWERPAGTPPGIYIVTIIVNSERKLLKMVLE